LADLETNKRLEETGVVKVPKLTATVTTKTEVTIAPKVQRKLLTELHGYAAVTSEMKALQESKEGHSASVLKLANEGVDGDKFELEGFKVAVVKGAKQRTFNKEKLIKRFLKDGTYSVKAAQALIEDCTDDSSKKDHVRITAPGEKDDN
jgi:hypothetical protein